MGALVVVEFVSLDGVMQGFHSPDERDGFRQSGWGASYQDETQLQMAVEALPSTTAYLFGRRTYEELARFWPSQPDENPMAAHLNRAAKHVVTNRHDELTWPNAYRLEGDLIEAVTRVKSGTDGNVTVLGSGAVVEQLLVADLVDGFELLVHPLVLGNGHQLFPRSDAAIRLQLQDVRRTSTGVVWLSYAVDR